MNRRIIAVCIILLVAGAYIHFVKPVAVPLVKPFSEFPVVVGDWRMINEDRFSADILRVLKPTDYLARQYMNGEGRVVTLYLGYHGGDKGGGGIHSPKNCLPSAGWFLDSREKLNVHVPEGRNLEVVSSLMSKGGRAVLFFYWFQVREWAMTSEYALKAAALWNSLSARRKDESFVRVSMPVDGRGGEPSGTLVRFVQDFYPVIMEYLPS